MPSTITLAQAVNGISIHDVVLREVAPTSPDASPNGTTESVTPIGVTGTIQEIAYLINMGSTFANKTVISASAFFKKSTAGQACDCEIVRNGTLGWSEASNTLTFANKTHEASPTPISKTFAANTSYQEVAGFGPFILDAIANRSNVLSFIITPVDLVSDVNCTFHSAQASLDTNHPYIEVLAADIPVITPTGTPLAYTAGSGAVDIDTGLTLTTDGPNTADVPAMEVSVGSFAENCALDYSGADGNVTATFDDETGVLTIVPKGDNFTQAEAQAILRDVTFTTDETSGSFTITFEATDEFDGVGTGQRTITVSEASSGASARGRTLDRTSSTTFRPMQLR